MPLMLTAIGFSVAIFLMTLINFLAINTMELTLKKPLPNNACSA